MPRSSKLFCIKVARLTSINAFSLFPTKFLVNILPRLTARLLSLGDLLQRGLLEFTLLTELPESNTYLKCEESTS
jgi:hypothetical protein